jgi:hypothetical protein
METDDGSYKAETKFLRYLQQFQTAKIYKSKVSYIHMK